MSLQSTDQIADLLTRIRNAIEANKNEILVPTSKLKVQVVEVLKKNGYVATYKNAQDFAKGILWCLDEKNYDTLCENAYKKAMNTYSEDRIARRYTDVYEMLLEQ